MVNFLKHGQQCRFEVDDYLPEKNDQLAFSKSYQGKIWVQLIERAMASRMGTYTAIESGNSSHVATDLTGAPSEEFSLNIAVDPWAKIVEGTREKFVMTAAIAERRDAAELRRMGLIAKHGYSLLSATEVTGPRG